MWIRLSDIVLQELYKVVHMQNVSYVGPLVLNREVVSSRPAAGSAGFAESSLVPQQQSIRAAILDLMAAHVPALRAVAVGVRCHVGAILDLTVSTGLPGRRVAAHLKEVSLLRCGGYFVLLCDHVL